jgi:hypothetical protein
MRELISKHIIPILCGGFLTLVGAGTGVMWELNGRISILESGKAEREVLREADTVLRTAHTQDIEALRREHASDISAVREEFTEDIVEMRKEHVADKDSLWGGHKRQGAETDVLAREVHKNTAAREILMIREKK